MIGNKKYFSSLTPQSHNEFVTFEDDKKGKVLGTSVIKVNDCFSFNDVAFFTSLIRIFSILLASMFVASLTLEMFFKLISHLLDLL
jgi:hypothetical protein